jgi:hypothetical protein
MEVQPDFSSFVQTKELVLENQDQIITFLKEVGKLYSL